MAAGYTLNANDLQAIAQGFAQQYISLMARSQWFMTRVQDYGTEAITTAYGNSTDATALEAMVGAVSDILLYATTVATTNLTATDNTAGGSTESVSVPVGSYAVVTADPVLIALIKSLSVDKSTPIRALSPLSPV